MMRRKRIIAEVKDYSELRKGTIDSVKRKYTYPFFPDEQHVVIPKRTKVSQQVRDYARKKKVKIIRLRGY
jgi:hypothetical protein